MTTLSEHTRTYYDKKWGKMYGVAPEGVRDALKMIGEIAEDTAYSIDDATVIYLYLYHKAKNSKPPESIFNKIVKSSSKGNGELVKFCRY